MNEKDIDGFWNWLKTESAKGNFATLIEAWQAALEYRDAQAELLQHPISDVTEAVTRCAIEVEKLLCEKLGKQWRASGMSIQTLVDELASRAASVQEEPVPWTDIISAIQAVTKEASERGKMFPQEAEAHSEDGAASRRVCELIKWYATCGGSVAEKLEGWPKRYAHPPTPPDVIGLAYALSKLIQGSEKCVEDEWGAGDAERIIPELSEAKSALANYEATK